MAIKDSAIERVLLWMVSGMSGPALENACISKLDVDPAEVKAIIAEARKRLTLASEYNRNEMLGTALTRLNDIYARCIRGDGNGNVNLAKALDVQKEINRLAGLYPTTGQAEDAPMRLEDMDLDLLSAAADAMGRDTPPP